jgi:hypothetical protein
MKILKQNKIIYEDSWKWRHVTCKNIYFEQKEGPFFTIK